MLAANPPLLGLGRHTRQSKEVVVVLIFLQLDQFN